MTISKLYRDIKKKLSENGIKNADIDASEIAVKAAGAKKITLYSDPLAEISPDAEAKAAEMTRRRISGEPLQYILGEWEFYGFPFEVGEGVLIPRQDTEILVDTVRGFLNKNSVCIDLCSGSGCVGIALSKLTGCKTIGYELSDKAIRYFKRNIVKNDAETLVSAVRGDVLSESNAESRVTADVITVNPPYLNAEDMKNLQREVTFEPEEALYGGEDGLGYYRTIIRLWETKLKKGGIFAAEVGINQAGEVKKIFSDYGIKANSVKDFNGIERVVYGEK